ncbi:MAG: hypothetical protein KDD42_01750, partial [Bdellovibrionales bacterium]|nr:hypothetical protein [Bdellovibrionales bacterium]
MSALAGRRELMPGLPKILFLAEAVTLAHIARPLSLAGQLDREHYQVYFASDDGYDSFVSGEDLFKIRIHSRSKDEFLDVLDRGAPLFEADLLRRYVADEIPLLQELQPDLVIGDLRPSLAVSARLVGIPYVNLTNAYWSPFASFRKIPFPCLRAMRNLPLR